MKRRLTGSLLLQALTIACIVLLPVAGTTALAQDQATSTPAEPAATVLDANQLDNLVAPIALYPDPLLGQLLVASTYPLEVVEVQQWLQLHKNLSGTGLMDAAKEENWDASVQALVAFPEIVTRLNQDIRWTTDLGNAFLAQQSDVMDAVQRMRARAKANGKLATTQQQVVTTETQDNQSVIQIQPADPQVMYVPSYDPMYVWGLPAWGYYPPLFYPGVGFGFGFGPGIYGGGFFGGGWGGWGGWGWGPRWGGRSVFVNNHFFNRYGFHNYRVAMGRGSGAWVHDPGHRQGVPYANRQTAARFGQANARTNRAATGRAGQNFQSQARSNSVAQARSNTASQGRSYSAPQGRSNTASQLRSNSTPQARSNAAPQTRSYSAPQARSYSAPQQRSYSAPQTRSYSAPQRSYSAPQRSYSAPQRSYSAPQRSYSAPQSHSSSSFGSRGGGGASGGGGGGRRR